MQLQRACLWCCVAIAIMASGCGRTTSRYLGKEHRQVLEIQNMTRFINVSFDKRGSSTVKDVTFEATDGYVYTQEFKDVSPLEGVIRWVPHDEEASYVQSRALSRWGGDAVNAQLPDDCAAVLCVDIGYASDDERVKNLCYRTTDGLILTREYRDGLIDRNLVGWMEIKGEPTETPAE